MAICGAGVSGACAAYYLSRRGIDVVVVERREVACAVSGKAGGFLALDSSAGSLLDGLSRRCFALRARLAEELDGDWGYRRLTTYGGCAAAVDEGPRRGEIDLGWVADRVTPRGVTAGPAASRVEAIVGMTRSRDGSARTPSRSDRWSQRSAVGDRDDGPPSKTRRDHVGTLLNLRVREMTDEERAEHALGLGP